MPFFLLTVLAGVLAGCAEPAVGAPCLPEDIPETGFDKRESYIESSSVQCETRVCIVHQLDGDPREGCVQTGPTVCPENDPTCVVATKCATEDDIEKSIFCTCRCDAADTGFAECDCPDGFGCQEILDRGGDGVRGGYCIRNSTIQK
jgi:hypothetical protein